MQNESQGRALSLQSRKQADEFKAFWQTKRNSPEMEAVYASLLRSERGAMKRHTYLSGPLAEVTNQQQLLQATQRQPPSPPSPPPPATNSPKPQV